ncbi:MAG: hypothetical protein K1X29_04430 [Bdellovibrionales bacterium]|nr:hypothetical protein [Bdellovibrionales bacterium]
MLGNLRKIIFLKVKAWLGFGALWSYGSSVEALPIVPLNSPNCSLLVQKGGEVPLFYVGPITDTGAVEVPPSVSIEGGTVQSNSGVGGNGGGENLISVVSVTGIVYLPPGVVVVNGHGQLEVIDKKMDVDPSIAVQLLAASLNDVNLGGHLPFPQVERGEVTGEDLSYIFYWLDQIFHDATKPIDFYPINRISRLNLRPELFDNNELLRLLVLRFMKSLFYFATNERGLDEGMRKKFAVALFDFINGNTQVLFLKLSLSGVEGSETSSDPIAQRVVSLFLEIQKLKMLHGDWGNLNFSSQTKIIIENVLNWIKYSFVEQ